MGLESNQELPGTVLGAKIVKKKIVSLRPAIISTPLNAGEVVSRPTLLSANSATQTVCLSLTILAFDALHKGSC